MFTSKIKKITIASLAIIVTAGLAIFGAGQTGLFKGSILGLNPEGSNTISYVPGSLEFNIVESGSPLNISLDIKSKTHPVSCLVRDTEEQLKTDLLAMTTTTANTTRISVIDTATTLTFPKSAPAISKFIGCKNLAATASDTQPLTNVIALGVNISNKYILQEAPNSILQSSHQATNTVDNISPIPLIMNDGSEFRYYTNTDGGQLRVQYTDNDEKAAFQIAGISGTETEKYTRIVWDGKLCKDMSISFENYTSTSNLNCPKGNYKLLFFDTMAFINAQLLTNLFIEPEVINPAISTTPGTLINFPINNISWDAYPVETGQTVRYDLVITEDNDFNPETPNIPVYNTSSSLTTATHSIPEAIVLSNGIYELKITARINSSTPPTTTTFEYEPRKFEREVALSSRPAISTSTASIGQEITITGSTFDRLFSVEPQTAGDPKRFISVKFRGVTNPEKIEVTTAADSKVTPTQIKVTVPSGATSGEITIGKPGTTDYDVNTSNELIVSTTPNPTTSISINSLDITGNTLTGKINAVTMPRACYFNTRANSFTTPEINTELARTTPNGVVKNWTEPFIVGISASNLSFDLTGLPTGISHTLVICEYSGNRREYTTFNVNTIAPATLTSTPVSDATTSATSTQFTWTKAPATQNGIAFDYYNVFIYNGTSEVTTSRATVNSIDTLSTTINNLTANTNYNYIVTANYLENATKFVVLTLTNPQSIRFNTGIASTSTLTISNTTSPVIATNQVPTNTTSVRFNPVTNIPATCQYRNTLTQTAFTNITTTGVTSHSFDLTGLANNTNYNIEIKCTANTSLTRTLTVPFGVGAAYEGPVELVNFTATNIASIGSIIPIQVSYPSTSQIDFGYIVLIDKDTNKNIKVIVLSCNQSSAITDIKNTCIDSNLNTAAITGPRNVTVNLNTAEVANKLDPKDYILKAFVVSSTNVRETKSREIEFTGRGSADDRLLPEESCEEYFDDMDDRDDLCEEIAYLQEEGIFLGQEVGRGRREANLNARLLRSEYFALASRLDGGGRSRVDESFLRRFRDLTPAIINDNRNDWWLEAVSSLQGVIRGYGDGTLRPGSTATQAELAKVAAETVVSGFENDDNQDPWFVDTVDLYDSYGFRLSPMSTATRADAVEILYTTLLIEEGLLDDEYDDRYDSRTSNGRSYRR
jgi:hypothetical protein